MEPKKSAWLPLHLPLADMRHKSVLGKSESRWNIWQKDDYMYALFVLEKPIYKL